MEKATKDRIDSIYASMDIFKRKDLSKDKSFSNLKDFLGEANIDWMGHTDAYGEREACSRIEDLIDRTHLSPQQVVQNASALKGRYFNGNINDFLKQRSTLLDATSTIQFRAATMTCKESQTQFQYKYQRDTFNTALDTTNWGVSADISAGAFGTTLDFKMDYDKKSNTAEQVNEDVSGSYFSKHFGSFVPVTLWEPKSADTSLSHDALSSLKDIEKLLSLKDVDSATRACELFFELYGSHVYLGDTHFGGLYHIETTFESSSIVEKELIHKAIESTFSTTLKANMLSLGVNISGHHEQVSDDASYKSENIDHNYVHTTQNSKGGPHVVSSFPLWKIGLLARNNTWVVIDGGTLNVNDYTSVWDIVLRQSIDFTDPIILSDFLMNTWQKRSGIRASQRNCPKDRIIAIDKHLEEVVNTLYHKLNVYDSKSYQTILMTLCEKVDEVQRTIGKTTVWSQQLRYNANAGAILKFALNMQFSQSEKTEICISLDKLLQSSGIAQFDGELELKNWMRPEYNSVTLGPFASKQIISIDQFMAELKTFLQRTRLQDPNYLAKEEHVVPATNIADLAQAISKLLRYFKKEQNEISTCAYILFASQLLALQYDFCNHCFTGSMTIEQLELFGQGLEAATKISNQITRLSKRQAWALQQYILCMREAQTTSTNTEVLSDVKASFKSQNLKYDTAIMSLLNSQKTDFETFNQSLDALMNGIEEFESKQHIAWDFFEKRENYCISNQQNRMPLEVCGATTSFKQIPSVIKNLHLSSYLPSKMSLLDVLSIRDKLSSPKKMSDLPIAILKRIISADFSYREGILHEFCTQNASSSDSGDKKISANADLLDTLLASSDEEDTIEESGSKLHPMDVFLAIFICCDPFLRRLISQKAFACKLSFPLVHQDVLSEKLIFSLWEIRDILPIQQQGSKHSAATKSSNIVSFIRIGDNQIMSKSKLINEFMRDENEVHNTFFHKDCALGMNRRTISEGSIEISWYAPADSRKKDPNIDESLTVLNLRGDANNYLKQTSLLLQASQILVVFITYSNLQQVTYTDLLKRIHQSRAYVILLTKIDEDKKESRTVMQKYMANTGMESSKTGLLSVFKKKDNRELNSFEIKECLRDCILKGLSNKTRQQSLYDISENLSNDFRSTEKDRKCMDGRRLAKNIFAKMTESSAVDNRKEIVFPLQGEHMWQEWSKLEKEKNRGGSKEKFDVKETVSKKMEAIRLKQVESINLSGVMALFAKTLMMNKDDKEIILYFLTWLKQYLNEESLVVLPECRQRLQNAYCTYERSRADSDKKLVDAAEQQLVRSSLGLEHFFRELGQVYQAFHACSLDMKLGISRNTYKLMCYLPCLVANILLLGEPVEIMDGDAANVPLSWVQAIFKELDRVLGNKKIMLLSILGVQSSGKSTLLNTMFGLQFAVSAGRCTRGIFIQLIPVDKSKSSHTFDYVMIVDTEGLRSPEMAGQKTHHDNELATLVIGMADIVMLNVKGENISEMENVLQIVVHEIMRLNQAYKHIDLRQAAVLIHQNVSTKDANKQLMQGCQKTVQNLDNITREAASQENSSISSFKEVIRFDPLTNVRYLPDLWHGTPPMAPVSRKYSEGAMSVLSSILSETALKQERFFTIENISLHLESLWKGILAEDFLFSFRNGVQIKAYAALEKECQRLKWVVQERTSIWCNENIKPKLNACSKEITLEQCTDDLIVDMQKKVETELKKVIKDMVEFIEKSDLNHEMIAWKETTLLKLDETCKNLEKSYKMKIQKECIHCRGFLKKDNMLQEKEKQIILKASSLANELKGSLPTQEQKEEKFEELWIIWYNEVTAEFPEDSLQSRKYQIKNELIETFRERFRQNFRQLPEIVKQQLLDGEIQQRLVCCLDGQISENDLNVTTWKAIKQWMSRWAKEFGMKESHMSLKLVATGIINKIFQKIEDYMNSLLETDTDYELTQFNKVLNFVVDGIESHNKDNDGHVPFKISPNLEMNVALKSMRYAFKQFLELCSQYQKKHSLSVHLKSWKPKAFQLFIDKVESKTNEIVASNQLCILLKETIQEKIERELPLKIQNTVRAEFDHIKQRLIKTVMEDLIKRNMFETFRQYICDPNDYVFKWLEQKTNDIMFQENKSNSSMYFTFASDSLSTIKRNVKQAAKQTTEQLAKVTHPDMMKWVQQFKENIKDEHFMLKSSDFQHITDIILTDFDNFLSYFIESFEMVEKKISETFRYHSVNNLKMKHPAIYDDIFRSLWGCTAKCPFCREPCSRSEKDHSSSCHVCVQHRPHGLGNNNYITSNKMTIESCSFSVQSQAEISCGNWCKCPSLPCGKFHPYKKYKTYVPDWTIETDNDMSSSKYWNWFIAKYGNDLARWYSIKPPEIPDSWTKISEHDAIESLHVYC